MVNTPQWIGTLKANPIKYTPREKEVDFPFFPPFPSSRKRSYTTLTFLIELKQGLKIKLSLITCHHGLQYERTEDKFIYKAIAEWTNIWLGCVEGTRGRLHIKRDIQREGEIHTEVWLLIIDSFQARVRYLPHFFFPQWNCSARCSFVSLSIFFYLILYACRECRPSHDLSGIALCHSW